MPREIHVMHDPAVSGYAHARVAIKPWWVFVDGIELTDGRGRPRRFGTKAAAEAAGRKAAA